jgi:predicted HTH domain antitoxin
MKSIFFIISSPLAIRDYHRYGIAELLSLNVDVKVIDISKLIYPKIYPNNMNVDLQELQIFHIDNYKNFISLLSDNTGSSIFISVGYLPPQILFSIKKLNCSITIQLWGSIPVHKNNMSKKIRKLVSNPVGMLKKVFCRTYDRLRFSNIDYDYYLTITPILGKKTILCHCYDYYIDLLGTDFTDAQNYKDTIVFIDQMIPYHTDFIKSGVTNKTNAEKYYHKLNKLFSRLEDQFSCKVVIAAHPRSISIDDYAKKFDDRLVILNKTNELISASKFTITHYSTAINLSVIKSKAIIFLCSDELSKLGQTEQIELMAHETESKIAYLEDDSELDIQLLLPANSYVDYKKKYITQRNDVKTNGMIIFDELLLNNSE